MIEIGVVVNPTRAKTKSDQSIASTVNPLFAELLTLTEESHVPQKHRLALEQSEKQEDEQEVDMGSYTQITTWPLLDIVEDTNDRVGMKSPLLPEFGEEQRNPLHVTLGETYAEKKNQGNRSNSQTSDEKEVMLPEEDLAKGAASTASAERTHQNRSVMGDKSLLLAHVEKTVSDDNEQSEGIDSEEKMKWMNKEGHFSNELDFKRSQVQFGGNALSLLSQEETSPLQDDELVNRDRSIIAVSSDFNHVSKSEKQNTQSTVVAEPTNNTFIHKVNRAEMQMHKKAKFSSELDHAQTDQPQMEEGLERSGKMKENVNYSGQIKQANVADVLDFDESIDTDTLHSQKDMQDSETSKNNHSRTHELDTPAFERGATDATATRVVQPLSTSGNMLSELLTKQLYRILNAAVLKQNADGNTQLTVKLHPETLGRMHIQLIQSGQGFLIKVFAEKKQTTEMLERALPGLRQLLQMPETKVEVSQFDDENSKEQATDDEREKEQEQREKREEEKPRNTFFQEWFSSEMNLEEELHDPN